MWSKWQKHPLQVLEKSTVIPIWHDIAKQGDWSVGSILQWQLQSCEIWLPTKKCPGRLKAVCQQILNFCLDLTACYQLNLHIIAALLHRDSVRVCLCWSLMLEKVHGQNHQSSNCADGRNCCSRAKCQLEKLPQFCTAGVWVSISEDSKPLFSITLYVHKHFLMQNIIKYCNSSLCAWSWHGTAIFPSGFVRSERSQAVECMGSQPICCILEVSACGANAQDCHTYPWVFLDVNLCKCSLGAL